MEYIWAYWKQHELPNVCPRDYMELSERARQALRRMRPKKRLIAAFWKQSSLAFDWRNIMRDSVGDPNIVQFGLMGFWRPNQRRSIQHWVHGHSLLKQAVEGPWCVPSSQSGSSEIALYTNGSQVPLARDGPQKGYRWR